MGGIPPSSPIGVLFLQDSLQIYFQHDITSLVTITMYLVRLELLHVLREITFKKIFDVHFTPWPG